MQLQFCGAPGVNYRFQASTNLIDWKDIASVPCDTNGVYRYTDTDVANFSHRFYRSVTP